MVLVVSSSWSLAGVLAADLSLLSVGVLVVGSCTLLATTAAGRPLCCPHHDNYHLHHDDDDHDHSDHHPRDHDHHHGRSPQHSLLRDVSAPRHAAVGGLVSGPCALIATPRQAALLDDPQPSRSAPPHGASLRLHATLRVTSTLAWRLTLQPVRCLLCTEEGKG